MQRDELAAGREDFSYDRVATLDRAERVATLERSTLGRRLDRDSYTVDVRASDLQLAPGRPVHPCLSYRTWLYSALIGVRQALHRRDG